MGGDAGRGCVGQARWAVTQAVLLLREHQEAYDALVAAMADNRPLGTPGPTTAPLRYAVADNRPLSTPWPAAAALKGT